MTFHRIRAVAARELASSAASPTAWVFLIIFLVLAGFCAFVAGNVFASGQADISPFFDWLPYLFLLIVPALAMPMWAEERRIGVFELTLSFPASIAELVVGKFAAGFLLLATAMRERCCSVRSTSQCPHSARRFPGARRRVFCSPCFSAEYSSSWGFHLCWKWRRDGCPTVSPR